MAIPRPLSRGEEEFWLHCRVQGLTPEREYLFHPLRKWRLDFAWPDLKLAVEIESSVHRIKSRFASDLDKYNALQRARWMLLRYTARMVASGQAINEVLEVLKSVQLLH
jgi:very-short-patch-repair endonuclease